MRQVRIAIGLLLAALLLIAGGPGFRSRKQFEEHFAKHGREFGNISPEEYLRLAQELRDAPAGGPILQVVKPDGVITRFDKRSGAFRSLQSRPDHATFSKPNDGERYFRRQAGGLHDR